LLAELGYAFVGKGDATGGEAYAAAAYRLAPTNPATADAWGWALYNLGDYDRAGQLLEKAVSLAPTVSSLRWHLAQTYWALKMKDKASMQARVALLDKTFQDRVAAEKMARGQEWS
jgi:predicted Zn-dependent protease